MPQLLWDASALSKRYIAEIGTATVDALFTATPALPMATTLIGYAETAAIQRRRRNQGLLTPAEFRDARTALRQEVYDAPDFTLLSGGCRCAGGHRTDRPAQPEHH